MDPTSCVPITVCYANPYQLAIDDQAAISRLYPVTSQTLSNFPGKQVFASTTARLYGSVFFTDTSGNPTQPMQGVNVVARWINPATGQPSGQYAASSVSGFLFTGNAGNPVTGFDDPLGNPFSDWGSNSSTLEGFFDLGGLQIPSGSSAQYQLTVEGLDPTWSAGVGPYPLYQQVAPSGVMQPITIALTAGDNVEQNILMTQSAQPVPQWAESQTWTTPAPVPQAGDWEASLGSYGETAYFSLPAQANRTMSIAVTALDESGSASETKLQPVIGMWPASSSEGTAPPALTTSSFNTVNFAMTRLDAQIGTSGSYLIGIADLRGDGRPDYHFHAQLLYGDSLSPSRVAVAGGPITVLGTGFSPRLTATIGSTAVTLLQASAGQVIISAPAQSDGVESITLTDPTTGGSTTLTNALTYGAAASDSIVLLSGGLNPQTPVGTQAANPITVRVLASDGVTPVAGATVGWTTTNNVQLSACSGASSCTVTTDQSGFATTRATPTVAGTSTITATLAPGVYSPSQSVSATLSATEPPTAIGALSQYTWIAQGATLSVPITVAVLSNGVPQNNATVNFTIVNGAGTLSAATAVTNSNGYASVSLSLAQFSAAAQVNACVAPSNAPCQQIYFNIVSLAQLNLQPIAGSGQVSAGQPFQPIVVRAVDSASPPDPVLGAEVSFQTLVMRPAGEPDQPTTPVILNASQNYVLSDANGLAGILPSSAGFSGPLQVNVLATAGTNAMLDYVLQLLPPFDSETQSSGTSQPILRAPLQRHLPIEER
jgi:hypothetical protein